MKAQVSPITMVLITGIIITLVGITYMWGAPLIEKQSIKTQYSTSTQFIKSLDELIVEVANSGGSAELKIPFGLVTLLAGDGEGANSVLFQYSANQPLVFSNTTTYIGDVSYEDVTGEVGVFGRSKPGIISLRSETSGTQLLVTMELHYRELDTSNPPKGFLISLVENGRSAGNNKITVTNEGTRTIAGRAANSGELAITEVGIRIS